MKIAVNIFLIGLASSLALTSCNYLDEKPYDWAQPKDVFSMEANYEKPINQAYSYIKGGFNRINGSFLEAATDDGMSTISGSTIHLLSRAYVTSTSPVESCWGNSYLGIRQALFVQKSLSEIDLVLNNKSSEDVMEVKNSYSGEMYCLRALFEFDLLRHYAGYPIVDNYYSLGDPELNQIKRNTFEECVNHIISLCDSAAKYLSVTPYGGNGGYGRMTKGSALAIKAKTLIFAASPLFNQPGNANAVLGYMGANDAAVKTRWEVAADACYNVISLKIPNGDTAHKFHNNYEKMFVTSPMNEFIVFATAAKSTGLENRQYPPTISSNSGGGTVPTQEFVDAFTLADGSEYVRPGGAPLYTGRDPRFAISIGYNGSKYGTRTALISTKLGTGLTNDGLNVIPDRSTNTGYYLKKFLDMNVDFTKSPVATAFHLFPIIRLADIYLCYAEAMNEAYGPLADPKGYGINAKAAVQRVRSRPGIFNAATDKYLLNVTSVDEMRQKIKNERRVELSFEEQRYFDLRRWMEAETRLNQPVNGIRIEQSGTTTTYDYFVVDPLRRFDTKMYLHPIPLSETKISPLITQNPGW